MNFNDISRKDFLKMSRKALIGTLLVGSSSFLLNSFTNEKAYASPYSFINTICEEARDIAYENNIHASVMLAQAIIESASGSSGLSKAPNYNLFGIKGKGTAGSVNMGTSEDDGSGNYYSINSAFRKYYSWQESMEDYADLIRSNNAYKGAWKENTNGDYHRAASALQGNYATSTSYAATLNSTINNYNLAQFDNQRDYSIENVRLSKIISYSRLNQGNTYENSLTFIKQSYKESYNIDISDGLSEFHEVLDEQYRISDVVLIDNGNYGIYIGTNLVSTLSDKLYICNIEELNIIKHYRYNGCLNDEERHEIYINNLEKEIKRSLEDKLLKKDESIIAEINDLYDFD